MIDTDRFVPEYSTRSHLGHVTFADVQVRAADRDRVHAHDRIGAFQEHQVGYLLPRTHARPVKTTAYMMTPSQSASTISSAGNCQPTRPPE